MLKYSLSCIKTWMLTASARNCGLRKYACPYLHPHWWGHNHWHAEYNVAKGHKSTLDVHEKVPYGWSFVLKHFPYKILAPKITNLKCLLCNFLGQNISEKRAHKMLMKLTPARFSLALFCRRVIMTT